MKQFLKAFTLFCLVVLVLSACAVATPEPTPTAIPATATTVPTPTPEPLEAVSIYYGEGSQFELTTPGGRRVLIDVFNPGALTAPATDQDILLVTHHHADHYNKDYVESFPGQKLIVAEGEIQLPDVKIRGIAAGHNATDNLLPKDGSDYIFIIDMAGVRLAHFGDIGQDEFTPEQLEALGQVDVAMTQFVNSFSYMNMSNMKGFNLMEQLKPRLILQTHTSLAAVEEAVKRWQGYASQQPTLVLTKELVPAETSIVFIGKTSTSYQKIHNLDWFPLP